MDTDPFQEPLPMLECPECGEAMEGAREPVPDDVAARATCHCPNGHTVVVQVVDEYEDDAGRD
jgi:hypothetical protein